jgi:hypothetical protein
MRVIADVPVQKLLGIGADTLGTLGLINALITFGASCSSPLNSSYSNNGLEPHFWSGPGVYCYSFCVITGSFRAMIHWLTPLPGKGYPNPCLKSDPQDSEKLRAVINVQINPLQEETSVEDPNVTEL